MATAPTPPQPPTIEDRLAKLEELAETIKVALAVHAALFNKVAAQPSNDDIAAKMQKYGIL